MGTWLMFLIVGLVGLVAVGVVASIVMGLVGAVFGVVGFLLFKVAPIVLLGWLGLKLFRKVTRRDRPISAADQRWLDS